MLYYLGLYLQTYWGPARLLSSYSVLIFLALYCAFIIVVTFLPKFYPILPHDRGREFTFTAKDALGKPTGSGVIFISIFVLVCIFFVPMGLFHILIITLTWLAMLSGFLDDRSVKSWGEYLKGFLDLILSIAASVIICYYISKRGEGVVYLWFPFIKGLVPINPILFVIIGTILIWASINTTNCTDGVDGLSGTLTLIALVTLGVVYYFVLGNTGIASYLKVPHLEDGAKWSLVTFSLAGVLMGYLWHNAFPSAVLMGDAGSRALGFFIGVAVLTTGNPLLFIATSAIMMLNGGTGLLKVALLRFFRIKILTGVRFPLHDHMRKNRGWSATQVLIKFMILQILVTLAIIGLSFKVR